jgi:Domain of unknown function (DUF5666)
MKPSHTRWFLLAPIGALLFAGVASVAFSLGVASSGPVAQAAQPTTIPGHPELGPGWHAPTSLRGASGQVSIAITKIDGSKLSLQTTDGWTRTIDATGATVTKGTQTIAVGDLKVGDQITFRESRQGDGTYKITTIQVVVPTAAGTVSSVAAGSVTITQSDGSSRTLTLTESTTYTQGGATVSKGALAVGVRISAQGTVASSGSFTATSITITPSNVLGTVASKTATAIVVTTKAGKSVTVNVSSTTKYNLRGVASPTLADVAVGYRIQAQGILNADGSLTATAVAAGPNDQPGFGPGGGSGRGGGRRGGPFPSPSAGASVPSV